MPSPLPNPDNDYLFSHDTRLDPATLTAVFGSIAARLKAQEATVADYEAAIDQLTNVALQMIAENVAPQLTAVNEQVVAIQTLAAQLEDQIADIRNGGIDAVNTRVDAIEGLDATNVQAALAELVTALGAKSAQSEVDAAIAAARAEAFRLAIIL